MNKLRFLILLLLSISTVRRVQAQEAGFSPALSNPQVTAITQDAQGYIWFGTSHGLNRYNGTTYTTFFSSGEQGALNNDHILALCQDSQGTLWIGTECGLSWYRDGRFYHHNTTVFDPVTHIEETDSTHISITGKSGIFQFDKNTVEMTAYEPLDGANFGQELIPSGISYTDRDGGLWEADGKDGWTYTAKDQPFKSLVVSPGNERISHLTFDAEGILWMRVGAALCSMDPVGGNILYKDGTHQYSSLFINRDGHLVVSRDGDTTVEYATRGGQPRKIRESRYPEGIFSMAEDREGNLWLSGISNLIKLERTSRRSTFEVGYEHPFSYIMPVSGTGRIFIVGLRDGILEIGTDGSVRPFGEGFQNVSAMLMSRDGTFWMGTYNDGLIHYDEGTGVIERFDTSSGIVDADIKSIVQDGDGYIWFSTATHITRLNPWNKAFSSMHDNSYRDGRFYDLVSAAMGPDGMVYLGGSGGITVIDPTAPIPERKDIPLYFEYLGVNDRQLPDNTEQLDLDYRENTLTLRFAGIDYVSGALLNYAWKLDGYEKAWHYGSSTPRVVYTYLPAGSYTFQARVREQNGEWSSREITLPIHIKPAPWASPLALTGYWILGIVFILTALGFFIRYRMQKDRLALAIQREEMNQQHIDFLTNVSHEFRTPLSLIFGPAKELEKTDMTRQQRELLGLIGSNAERLRTLSEQILSSSGRETHESLTVRENDLTSLLRSITGMFSFAAAEKEQRLESVFPETCIGYFDTEKVSKIVGNLLSNAVKYTPDGGHIRIALEMDGSRAVISVSDDGPGISSEKRDRIFDRFDRLGAEGTKTIGSGIGLHYARDLAQLHKGSLDFAPNQPQGSVFRFVFPSDASSYPDAVSSSAQLPQEEIFAEQEEGGKEQTILIAEDTAGLRLFLGNLFRGQYNVMLASDGLTAEDHLKLSLPDLILSDVVMPGKTGYALCADVKANPDWSHIPVVLLTARADAESSIEGMQAGADAYIPKPFDPDVLKATVESILRNRRLLQEKVRSLTSADKEEAQALELPAADRKLLEKLHTYLDANLENEQWDIAAMAAELGMSYSSLYAKVKAITGETPKAYVTSYRMNVALKLLKRDGLNVSEVAYRVGSSSPSTFSREFKKHFGYPPSQVK